MDVAVTAADEILVQSSFLSAETEAEIMPNEH